MPIARPLVRPARFAALLLIAALTLTACGGKHPPTGASSPYSNLKATQRPYTVLGKRYEPIPSHVGFVQEGIASWYGKDFHGKATSNGETYDMYAMTAAHKTLPLGVYVRVTNRENGKSVIVRVNDRGPFVKNRVIDLSYAAAKKLGYDGEGTAPVRIVALGYRIPGEAATASYHEPESYDSGDYSVQVGAFKDIRNATRLSEEMRKRFGFSVVRSAIVNSEQFYRVHAGRYTSLREAEEAEQKLEDQGYPGSFTVSLQ